jgi:hypothetical protein
MRVRDITRKKENQRSLAFYSEAKSDRGVIELSLPGASEP